MATPITVVQYHTRLLANIIRQKKRKQKIYIENKEVVFIGDMIMLTKESTAAKIWALKQL